MFLCMIVRIQILISMTECFFVLTFVLFVFNLMDWDNPKCVYNFTAIAIIFVLKSIFFFKFKKLCVRAVWGRRAEEVGVSVNTAKLFSNVDKEEDHLKLLADLVDKSLTDPTVTRKILKHTTFTSCVTSSKRHLEKLKSTYGNFRRLWCQCIIFGGRLRSLSQITYFRSSLLDLGVF